MALPTIELDDLDYDGLLNILRSQIRGERWSDHNPSDPGIALLELLTWLGEMDLYRLNRVPLEHRTKFLKLLLDPPVPVTARVTVELDPPRATDFELAPGLLVATDFDGGRRKVYESVTRAVLRAPAPPPLPPMPQTAELTLRAVSRLENVVLGVSNGLPDQTFTLPGAPVVLDFVTREDPKPGGAPFYDPNPKLSVGGDTSWELRPFLRVPASQGSPPPKHFMVEEFENRIRFGDGTFGAIPAPGAIITLLECRVLEGPLSLVGKGQLKYVLNANDRSDLTAAETLSIVASSDAEGGDNFPSATEGFGASDERVRRGLTAFQNPTRVVTSADFERVASTDFNVFQHNFNLATGAPADDDTILRAVAVMNKKPPLVVDIPSPSHVTLMVVPFFEDADFEAALTVADKAALLTVDADLEARLLAYFEPRRLITTRLHVVGAELAPVSAHVVAVIDPQRNVNELAKVIDDRLRTFFHVLRGYEDGRGWPLGRAVRRSQLYRLLEDIDGVDHVDTLTLSPADSNGDVVLDQRQLPTWDSLVVEARRP